MYYDRLVDDEDRKWLIKYIKKVTKTHLEENFHSLFSHLDSDGDGIVSQDDLRSMIFNDFCDPKNTHKNYIEALDMEQMTKVVESYLEEFNSISKKPMNLVLFR